jgi:F-type H+-transporting ATPase subunit b
MDETFKALGGIVLTAVPTLLLIIFLHFYLKIVFFNPLKKVLAERDEATAGARRKAEESLAKAEEKARQYEETLRQARNEIYKEQEEQRKRWKADQDAAVATAAKSAKEQVSAAQEAIAGEVAAARQTLEADSRVLAAKIADSVLEGRAA